MSRMLAYSVVLGAWSVVFQGVMPVAHAQAPPAARQPRPQANAALQVKPLPPQLEKLLKDWSRHSAQIQKLQGTHRRIVYDNVFMVEKHSTGAFYYEAPSKGRIDIQPAKIEVGQKVQRKHPKTGKVLTYTLKQDLPQRWICDGTYISQVNESTKQVEKFPIPPENQGQNIMDGPLPFLFGMPPEKAKLRYNISFSPNRSPNLPPAYVQLDVLPRLRVDAANWQSAEVILDTKQYLPRAVRLVDPTGNTETTYIFSNLEANAPKPKWWQGVFGDRDPFDPDLKGYAVKVHQFEDKTAQAPASTASVVPSVMNLGWQDAKARLEQVGYKVKYVPGKRSAQKKLDYVVYDQTPPAKTPLPKGQEVALTTYIPEGVVPAVSGMTWKSADALLKQAGYKVKYIPGQTAQSKEQIYTVYQQTPGAGQKLQPGEEVTVTVYNKIPE